MVDSNNDTNSSKCNDDTYLNDIPEEDLKLINHLNWLYGGYKMRNRKDDLVYNENKIFRKVQKDLDTAIKSHTNIQKKGRGRPLKSKKKLESSSKTNKTNWNKESKSHTHIKNVDNGLNKVYNKNNNKEKEDNKNNKNKNISIKEEPSVFENNNKDNINNKENLEEVDLISVSDFLESDEDIEDQLLNSRNLLNRRLRFNYGCNLNDHRRPTWPQNFNLKNKIEYFINKKIADATEFRIYEPTTLSICDQFALQNHEAMVADSDRVHYYRAAMFWTGHNNEGVISIKNNILDYCRNNNMKSSLYSNYEKIQPRKNENNKLLEMQNNNNNSNKFSYNNAANNVEENKIEMKEQMQQQNSSSNKENDNNLMQQNNENCSNKQIESNRNNVDNKSMQQNENAAENIGSMNIQIEISEMQNKNNSSTNNFEQHIEIQELSEQQNTSNSSNIDDAAESESSRNNVGNNSMQHNKNIEQQKLLEMQNEENNLEITNNFDLNNENIDKQMNEMDGLRSLYSLDGLSNLFRGKTFEQLSNESTGTSYPSSQNNQNYNDSETDNLYSENLGLNTNEIYSNSSSYNEIGFNSNYNIIVNTNSSNEYLNELNYYCSNKKILEIGTGPMCVLAMNAVKAGAKSVDALEVSVPASRLAGKLMAAYGFNNIIKVFNTHSKLFVFDQNEYFKNYNIKHSPMYPTSITPKFKRPTINDFNTAANNVEENKISFKEQMQQQNNSSTKEIDSNRNYVENNLMQQNKNNSSNTDNLEQHIEIQELSEQQKNDNSSTLFNDNNLMQQDKSNEQQNENAAENISSMNNQRELLEMQNKYNVQLESENSSNNDAANENYNIVDINSSSSSLKDYSNIFSDDKLHYKEEKEFALPFDPPYDMVISEILGDFASQEGVADVFLDFQRRILFENKQFIDTVKSIPYKASTMFVPSFFPDSSNIINKSSADPEMTIFSPSKKMLQSVGMRIDNLPVCDEWLPLEHLDLEKWMLPQMCQHHLNLFRVSTHGEIAGLLLGIDVEIRPGEHFGTRYGHCESWYTNLLLFDNEYTVFENDLILVNSIANLTNYVKANCDGAKIDVSKPSYSFQVYILSPIDLTQSFANKHTNPNKYYKGEKLYKSNNNENNSMQQNKNNSSTKEIDSNRNNVDNNLMQQNKNNSSNTNNLEQHIEIQELSEQQNEILEQQENDNSSKIDYFNENTSSMNNQRELLLELQNKNNNRNKFSYNNAANNVEENKISFKEQMQQQNNSSTKEGENNLMKQESFVRPDEKNMFNLNTLFCDNKDNFFNTVKMPCKELMEISYEIGEVHKLSFSDLNKKYDTNSTSCSLADDVLNGFQYVQFNGNTYKIIHKPPPIYIDYHEQTSTIYYDTPCAKRKMHTDPPKRYNKMKFKALK